MDGTLEGSSARVRIVKYMLMWKGGAYINVSPGGAYINVSPGGN